MAIDISNSDHRARLSRALRRSHTDSFKARNIRRNLIDIYLDRPNEGFEYLDDNLGLGTLVNLFSKFVKGHLLALAHQSPKWSINARTQEGRGFDKRMQSFLLRYTELLNFNSVQKQLALDSAFGWAVAKVDNGLAPKGITAPYAPRVYRLDPDMVIVDKASATFDECSFIGDMYLVPLNEAVNHPGWNPEEINSISEYRFSSGTSALPNNVGTNDVFAEPMTRLMDVYIPKAGMIYTWSVPNDEFHQVSQQPLGARPSSINPYTFLSLMNFPGFLEESSRLSNLRGLHLLANEMLMKGVQQARSSQRNPVGPLGHEKDMTTALEAGDNNPIFLEDSSALSLYSIPGPDPAVLSLGSMAAQMFSQEAGNLEVALGASTGAATAKQTEALLGQISASQSIDRRAFEEFMAEIGKKILTLAFESEVLELNTISRVPGTTIEYNTLWAPPEQMPRTAAIDSYNFEVVPYSSTFRSPEDRLGQLQQASQLLMNWMMAKAQGAPVSMEAITTSVSEAFDLVPELQEWWNGQEPTPEEKTTQTYQSLTTPSQGSEVRYQGVDQGQGAGIFPENIQPGGLS